MKRLTTKAARGIKKSQFDDLVQKISRLAVSLRILEAEAKKAVKNNYVCPICKSRIKGIVVE